jgi:hypothetical protein
MTGDLIFRHSWLLFVAVTCANGAVWWSRGKKEIANHPELEQGYRQLVRGWLIYGNLPWVVMGAGILLGGVPSVWQYLNPRNGPFVIMWYVTVVALWVATVYWVFLRGGAEALVRHPGLLNLPVQQPWAVKALVVLMLLGGVAGLAMMILGDTPVPGAAVQHELQRTPGPNGASPLISVFCGWGGG